MGYVFFFIFPGGEITVRSYPILLFFESLNTYQQVLYFHETADRKKKF